MKNNSAVNLAMSEIMKKSCGKCLKHFADFYDFVYL